MRNNRFVSIIFVVLFSWLTSYIVYFGFVSNYAVNYFSEDTYKKVFEHGVFRYRILGRYLLLGLYDFLNNYYPDNTTYRYTYYLDQHANANFYNAFFYLNTFFLMLTAVVSVFLLDLKSFIKTAVPDRRLILFFIPIFINLTQFAITAYDMIGYFLELLTLYTLLKWLDKSYIFSLVTMSILIILATLNRESSLLTVTLLITLIVGHFGLSDRGIVAVFSVTLSFLIPYIALRLFISPDSTGPNMAEGNYGLFVNKMGALFWILFFCLALAISNTRKNRKMVIIYHIISLPYIIFIFTGAVLWEVRLYVPLFLGSLFIAKLDEEYFRSFPFKNRPASPS